MSGVLSRPVHTDQKDMRFGLPTPLEDNAAAEVPTPIASVAYQAQIGVIISPLFRRLGRDNSIDITLKIQKEVETWMDAFPPTLRDHRPDTKWDATYPYIPFMRWQLNVVAYSFLLGPLKAYLIGLADPQVRGTKREFELRAKGVDVCLHLLDAAECFYKLIYPASVKYFFILFFIFDGATVLCSALAHDPDRSLPKRERVILALRHSLGLLEDVSHLSKTAEISATVLKSLMTILPLTAQERTILEWDTRSKRMKMGSNPSLDSSTLHKAADWCGSSSRLASLDAVHSVPKPTSSGDQITEWQFNPAKMPNMGSDPDSSRMRTDSSGGKSGSQLEPIANPQRNEEVDKFMPITMNSITSLPLEHMENLWDWRYLNMGL